MAAISGAEPNHLLTDVYMLEKHGEKHGDRCAVLKIPYLSPCFA